MFNIFVAESDKPAPEDQVIPVTADVGVMNTTAVASQVRFPTPWTLRCQTPIRRVVHGNMWGGDPPDTYGGPQ